jgi:hypothetical protein
MKQNKKKFYFHVRVKYDKPIKKKNVNDFNDSSVNPSLCFKESKEKAKEIENGQPKGKKKSILKNSNKKVSLYKKLIYGEDLNNGKQKNRNIRFKLIEDLYSDIEEENDLEHKKEMSRNKKIEKDLLRSVSNNERITRERLILAETINFKDKPDKIICTDRYGFIGKNNNSPINGMNKNFKKKSSKKVNFSQSCEEILQINARSEKWNYMLHHYPEFISHKRDILKSRTRKGIPDNLRGYVWQLFAEKKKYYIPNLYYNLEKQPINEDLETVIMKDLDRTFPLLHFFSEKYGNGQRRLYKVLSAYSKFNTKVGYVQGMAYIVAIFLLYMDEESSFFMLHSLLKKYDMESIFYDDFPGLRKKFFVLLNLEKKLLPKIYKIFQRDGIIPTMYANTWFISIFAKTLEFRIVLRIFDCLFLEGFKVIYRIALALLKLKENEFLKAEKGETMPLLVSCTNNVDEEELFKVAFSFSISRNFIDKLELEYMKVKEDENNEFIAQLFW